MVPCNDPQRPPNSLCRLSRACPIGAISLPSPSPGSCCELPAKTRDRRKEKLTAHTTDVIATTADVASATTTECSSDTRGVAAAFL